MATLHKLFFGLIFLQSGFAFSQGKFIVNGATVNVLNGAYLTTGDVSLTSASTLRADSSTLVVGDSINSVSNIILRYGTLEMIGANRQSIPAGSFQNNAVNDLIINNSSFRGVFLRGPVDIYKSLTYAGSSMKLTTNDDLTIKSIATRTAYVGDVTGNTITGEVTVERYIPARKAWRLLSIPTDNSQTIKETWQEGATSTASNFVPGYGIQISSDRTSWATDGFDLYSKPGPSMKTYDPATNTFVGVTATTNGIRNNSGYFVFIRGDRTVNTYNGAPTETTLRTKGPLYTYDQSPISVGPNQFTSIGNPYASAVNMSFIAKTAGIRDFFYIWDPKLGGNYGYGAYQTFTKNSSDDYEVTPGNGSYGPSGTVYNYIESGQAFLVQGGAAGGTLTFKENAKAVTNGIIGRVSGSNKRSSLRANLYGVSADSSSYMDDGILINYDDNYSNAVDDLDAVKASNTSENLALKNGNTLLVVERRHTIVQDDTIFLNLSRTKTQHYRFEFMADKLSRAGLSGFLEDSYLHTSTPLNMDGKTMVDFTVVNVAGSYATNRFQIVFKQLNTLPVTFNSIKAYRQDKNIDVEWKVENELNIKQYEVERSANGIDFTTLTAIKPTSNKGTSASYVFADTKPATGYNYYRIRSIDVNGAISYSTIVKVLLENNVPQITVYPNPVVNGVINLQLNNLPEASYNIKLMNKAGQVMLSKEIHHAAGSSTESIHLDKYTPHGMYNLEVSSVDMPSKIIEIVY